MTAGLNLTVTVFRINDQADDDIGGSQPSGTAIYSGIEGRIFARKPTQALLEQGLETPTIFSGVLVPGTLDVQPNDQIEVTYPLTSFYFGRRFVVIGIQHSSMTDARSFLVVTLRRFEKAHSKLLQ